MRFGNLGSLESVNYIACVISSTPHMYSSDLHRVDIRDGIQEVVCLINDDHITFQLDTNCLTGWSV